MVNSIPVTTVGQSLLKTAIDESGVTHTNFIRNLLTDFSKEFRRYSYDRVRSEFPAAFSEDFLGKFAHKGLIPDVFVADTYDLMFQQPPETCYLEPSVYDFIYDIIEARHGQDVASNNFEEVAGAVDLCVGHLSRMIFELIGRNNSDPYADYVAIKTHVSNGNLYIAVA